MGAKTLAAKICSPILIATAVASPVTAGIPVTDAGNLAQNMLTAIESVAQTLKQIEEHETQLEQYATQLQQYENMLQNTASPPSYLWDRASETIDNLIGTIDRLSYYKQQLGSLNAYLAQFQNTDHYLRSPCFTDTGCNDVEWASLERTPRLASEAQKDANDAMLKALEQQQLALKQDAGRLSQLQQNAHTASGQMQALGYANQFASQQTHQLLQIRGLLIAHHNALAPQLQSQIDREAKHQASHAASTEGRIEPTRAPSNWLELNRKGGGR